MEQANNGKDGIFSEGTPTCCAPEELAISRCLYISDAIISQGRVAKIKKKKKEKVFLQASLDSLDRGKKVDRENDRVVPPECYKDLYMYNNLFLNRR